MSTADDSQQTDSRKLWYGILIALLLGTWSYIIYDKSKTKETIAQRDSQILTVNSEKDSIQLAFNSASSKLDSLQTSNTKFQGALAEQNDKISKLKSDISSILNKRNATDEELKRAKDEIGQLKTEIEGYSAEIERLKGENKVLTSANAQLTTQKDSLNAATKTLQQNLSNTEAAKRNVEDLASTLHASNISIAAIEKKSSGKEVLTSTAKKADLLRFTFDLDENMVSPSGVKQIYIAVTGPDGKAITDGSTFVSREEGAKVYTLRVDSTYEQGKRKTIKADWKNTTGKYQVGDYKISIYNNGFKIGEGVKNLKKSTFLGL